jgi:isoleucyl-tRNA synthetase
MKDLWYRFTTMKGSRVVFRAGWDTQGLPVELEAERELGLTGSKVENLQAVGEEALVNACKRIVHKYHRVWSEADARLGLLLDGERAYFTYRDDYIEREWKYLEVAWARGLLGEGFRVIAYCPSCQTSLSHAEVGLGYELVEDPSLYFKVRLTEEDAYLVLWTTMPFTVVTDELVGVHPEAAYTYTQVGEEVWIAARARLEALMKDLAISDYKVIKTVPGAQLAGRRYQYPLARHVPGQQALDQHPAVHRIVAEAFVDVSTGSGLVHMSPANGEEDFDIARRRNIPLFNPIDDQVRFTAEAGAFAGLFVRDADRRVTELLRQEDLLLKESLVQHEYPTCWRSHHKVVWMARRGYFYWLERLGDLPERAASDVEYFFEPPRNRFLDIVRERRSWCISRERIWGTPLPIWVCRTCKEKVPAFSRAEIVQKALTLPDGPEFELHRPWIDRILLRCPACGGEAQREPYVLDAWHNSGAAPYASFTDEDSQRLVPVPFLTEAIDQTRGWAYSLLMEHVLRTGRPEAPYQAFLFQGHALDDKGNKMSKSLGNVIEALDILGAHSADVLRFYYLWKAPPIDSLNFSLAEMAGRPFQVLNTLYHLHLYFQQNSQLDTFDAHAHSIGWARERALLRTVDLWVLTHLQDLVRVVTGGLERCQFHEAVRALERFVIDTLSQGYLPLTRAELWTDAAETRDRRLAVHAVIAYCLAVVDALLYPVSPYLAEYLRLRCFSAEPQVGLLVEWPKAEPALESSVARDTFDLLQAVVSAASAARMKAGIKRRWPLSRAICVLPPDRLAPLSKEEDTLREQLNVKEITFTSHLRAIPLPLSVKLRGRMQGREGRKSAQAIRNTLAKQDAHEVHEDFREGTWKLRTEDGTIELERDELEFTFGQSENGVAELRDHLAVFLDLVRDPMLTGEGLARDLARRLQALRKAQGRNPAELLARAFVVGLDDRAKNLLEPHLQRLAFLVRAREVQFPETTLPARQWSQSDLDGRPISLALE